MDRTDVVAGMASDLYATETAVDASIAHATSLIQSMIAARSTLSLSALVGSGSQAKAMEALTALGAAREAIVATHSEMSREHRKMGWGIYAVGPLNKPPEDGRPIETDVKPHLRVA